MALPMVCSKGVATKIRARGPMTESEAYEGASAKSGRAGTTGPMLKSYETWGCRRGVFGESGGCSAPPGTPGGDVWGSAEEHTCETRLSSSPT